MPEANPIPAASNPVGRYPDRTPGPAPKPKLLDPFPQSLRSRRYSRRTEGRGNRPPRPLALSLGVRTKMSVTLAMLILMGGICLASEEKPMIPVGVHAQAELAVFKTGRPLLMSLTLTNGLSRPIRFKIFSTEPSELNGETFNISLVDVYRNGEKRNLYLARPELRGLLTMSGPGSRSIQPGKNLRVTIDMSKWRIDGDWIQGEYELVFRMDNITVEDKISMSILSEPVHVIVQ